MRSIRRPITASIQQFFNRDKKAKIRQSEKMPSHFYSVALFYLSPDIKGKDGLAKFYKTHYVI